MIHVMANARIELKCGDDKIVTELGFNQLPDWVRQDPYFEMCKSGLTPLLTEFEGSSDKSLDKAEAIALENEELKQRIKALEEAQALGKTDEAKEIIEDVENKIAEKEAKSTK